MVTLGLVPLDVTVVLARDAGFVASIVADDDSGWPDGTAVALVFSTSARAAQPTGLRWEATVDGDTAAWDVEDEDVAAVIAAGVQFARLLYTEADGTVLLWGRGQVRVV